jgi:hypothetical protein
MATSVSSSALLAHLDNRPTDAEIGFRQFDLGLLRAYARGDQHVDAIETLALGDYLPVVLSHAGWWMQCVDLVAGMPGQDAFRPWLGPIEKALAQLLAAVPKAWRQTYLHSGRASHVCAGRRVLSRYLRLRTLVCDLLAAVLPSPELAAFAQLA